jgi:hypothetical protein
LSIYKPIPAPFAPDQFAEVASPYSRRFLALFFRDILCTMLLISLLQKGFKIIQAAFREIQRLAESFSGDFDSILCDFLHLRGYIGCTCHNMAYPTLKKAMITVYNILLD